MNQTCGDGLRPDDTADHPRLADEPDLPFLGKAGCPVRVVFGGLSHPGRVRPNNEDHFAVVRRRRRRDLLVSNLPEGFLPDIDEDAYVLVVADGMGGAAFGELASLLALTTGWDIGFRDVKWSIKVDRSEVRELMQKAAAYYREVDRVLIEHGRREPRVIGMGTTLTLAYTIGTEVVIAHAGDSRAYRHPRGGSLARLTRDHTMAQELADFGVIKPEEVTTHRLRNVLTNVLGGPGVGVDPDIHHVRLEDGDDLLLCTDGLTDLVADDEIAGILNANEDPQAACQALVNLALERGGTDNVTVALGRYRVVDAAEDPAKPINGA